MDCCSRRGGAIIEVAAASSKESIVYHCVCELMKKNAD